MTKKERKRCTAFSLVKSIDRLISVIEYFNILPDMLLIRWDVHVFKSIYNWCSSVYNWITICFNIKFMQEIHKMRVSDIIAITEREMYLAHKQNVHNFYQIKWVESLWIRIKSVFWHPSLLGNTFPEVAEKLDSQNYEDAQETDPKWTRNSFRRLKAMLPNRVQPKSALRERSVLIFPPVLQIKSKGNISSAYQLPRITFRLENLLLLNPHAALNIKQWDRLKHICAVIHHCTHYLGSEGLLFIRLGCLLCL